MSDSEAFGNPNRQYGIPGIDNVSGPAQQAGVSAYQNTRSGGGSDEQAKQAAVNAAAVSIQTNPENTGPSGETAAQALTVWEAQHGTTSPNDAPKGIVTGAWLNAGAPDYNALAAAGVSGYTGEENVRLANTSANIAAVQAAAGGGSSLSGPMQALVNSVRAIAAAPGTTQTSLQQQSQDLIGAYNSALQIQATGQGIARAIGGQQGVTARTGQTLADQPTSVQQSYMSAYGNDALAAAKAWASAQPGGAADSTPAGLPSENTGPSGESAMAGLSGTAGTVLGTLEGGAVGASLQVASTVERYAVPIAVGGAAWLYLSHRKPSRRRR